MEFHPYAAIFPLMDAANLSGLAGDIRQQGLREPIIRLDGQILDGRNRYLACQQAGVEPRFVDYAGDDPVSFVVSANLHRRHLTESQRAMIGAAIKPLFEEQARARQQATQAKPGEKIGAKVRANLREPTNEGKAAEHAAAAVNVSPRSIESASRVIEHGAPELAAAVRAGDLKVSAAATLTALPVEEQARLIDASDKSAILNRAKEIRGERALIKKEIRLEAMRERYAVTQTYPPVLVQQDAVDFLTAIPEGSVDLLLTDPPYMTDVEDIEAFVASWLPLALTRIADHGRAYIFTGSYPAELLAYLRRLLAQDRLKFQDVLVWGYQNTLGPAPTYSYKRNWQACFYLYGPKAPPLTCPALTEQFAARMVNAPDARTGVRLHGWQKPDDLAQQLILHSTQPGQTLIDPFAGTGTFVAAAALLGRKALACDIDPAMLALCQQRGLSLTTVETSGEELIDATR